MIQLVMYQCILIGLARWPVLETDSACGSMVLHDSMLFAFALYERKSKQQ